MGVASRTIPIYAYCLSQDSMGIKKFHTLSGTDDPNSRARTRDHRWLTTLPRFRHPNLQQYGEASQYNICTLKQIEVLASKPSAVRVNTGRKVGRSTPLARPKT